MDSYTVLIIDDHDSVRNMLGGILLKLIPDIQISEASTLAQARQKLTDQSFQLAIVDINLPDGDEISLLPEIRIKHPAIYIVMCTIYNDDRHLFDALKAGAGGYLLKGQTEEQLTTKFRGMLKGEPPLSSSVARRMLQHFHLPPKIRLNH
ncbi:MAG: DNA-binding NarL/FixJ family response regulator [Parasphingorhabdus sp.]|jgi:DNA-binding NarL/FixJ family response regulator